MGQVLSWIGFVAGWIPAVQFELGDAKIVVGGVLLLSLSLLLEKTEEKWSKYQSFVV